MAHAQPRVASSLLIERRSPPVLSQEEGKVLFARLEVLGIHGPEGLVGLDTLVETIHQIDEEFDAADSIEQGLIHGTDRIGFRFA